MPHKALYWNVDQPIEDKQAVPRECSCGLVLLDDAEIHEDVHFF